MYVLVIKTPDQRVMHLSKRKKSLQQYVETAKRNNWTWRMHNGLGWCDGSEKAYEKIQSLNELCLAMIHY